MSMGRHYPLGDHELVIHRLQNGGLMFEIDPDTPHYRMVDADPQTAQWILSFLTMPYKCENDDDTSYQ